ncbi:MAG TPA: hypothetical protein PKV13_07720 [Propionicimonas sp.]|nr:hypothetical protein [Propionicimonas sp.]HRA06491.1 hypothetical protein [Propionicimonas sp.]
MSEAREELIRLIDELSDELVSTPLTSARALSTPDPEKGRPWPPAFFGSIERAANGHTDNASRVDEYLAESGFGQDSRECWWRLHPLVAGVRNLERGQILIARMSHGTIKACHSP